MELEILYQDAAIVVVDKPAGMLVHPGREPEPRDQIAMKVLRDQLGKHIYPVSSFGSSNFGRSAFCAGEKKWWHRFAVNSMSNW